jgi:drug/metabolite transporter (DMT)-like permease
MYFFLVPVFGLGIASVVFGESVGVFEGLGVAFILAGIGITTWEFRATAPQSRAVARESDATSA